MAEQRGTDGSRPGAGKVDLDAIRQLLALMDEHGLAELEIEDDEMSVRLRKAGAQAPTPVPMPAAAPAPAAAAVPGAAAAAARPKDEGLETIDSPMVGTYYEAPSPEAEPCVSVGDHVDESTVVCIVEAMKVFNEIRAEKSGTIERVFARNAQAVEFGQPLFAIRPD